jgi:hypothetical protein
MRLLSLTVTGVAGLGMLLAAASANSANPANATVARPPLRAFGVPERAALPPVPHGRRRLTTTPSCSGGSEGHFAFDTSRTFALSPSGTINFGQSNFAAGGDSGVFEGNDNTICDYNSAIAAGLENVLDSGAGNTPSGAADSFIGAGLSNTVSGSVAFLGAGNSNTVSGHEGFVGAGFGNQVSGEGSFIGAGGVYFADNPNNQVSGTDSFIGAGDDNQVSGAGSFIGSGGVNVRGSVSNQVSGTDSFIGAGDLNEVSNADAFLGSGSNNMVSADEGFVGAGYANVVSGQDSFIGGGAQNAIQTNDAFVGGGDENSVSGQYGTIPGGEGNTVQGYLGFAAGYHARDVHAGAFVWSDYVSGSKTVSDTVKNEFVVRASGGTEIYSSEALSSGVELAAGGGSGASVSDSNVKTDIVPLDDGSVSAKVAALPLSTWQYKSERGVRHVGPMAQDFYAAFGVGEDDRHITSIDEDGVALAAIKALNRKMAGLQEENARLRSRLTLLASELRSALQNGQLRGTK